MGFLDALSTTLDRVGGAFQGFVMSGGNPLGAVTGVAGVEQAKRQEKILERAMQYPDYGQAPLTYNTAAMTPAGSNSSGFFAPQGAFRQGVRDFGGFLSDFSPIAGIFGMGDRFQQTAPPAAKTITRQAPDESSTSGEITGANLALLNPLLQAGRQLVRSPAGQGLIGSGGVFGAAALMGADTGQLRITRRMKSDVRKIYMMANMDPNMTAQILNNLGTYPRFNFDASLVFLILTKRFRNDGPVVTKAAVRKTKTTLRRMKGVVDMYNSVCKPTTRRAPTRRAAPKAVQLIKN